MYENMEQMDQMGLTPYPMEPTFVEQYYHIKNYRETTTKFSKPTPNRRYVKILGTCASRPRTIKEIYPGVDKPYTPMLRDMVRAGLLERYTDGRRSYYYATDAGIDLWWRCRY